MIREIKKGYVMTNEKKNLEPLYEKGPNGCYICSATGEKCEMATQHFQDYAKFINDLAEQHSPRIIMQGEPNLCLYASPKYMSRPCSIYLKALKEKTH